MKAIHLRIDIQKRESESYSAEDWEILTGRTLYATRALRLYDVPTIGVVLVWDAPSLLGAFEDVRKELLASKEYMAATPHDKKYMADQLQPGTSVIAVKNGFSAFSCEPLRDYLEKAGFDTIILSGINVATSDNEWPDECCVTQTAKDFAERSKHKVIIAADATNAVLGGSLSDIWEMRSVHSPFGVRVEPLSVILAELEHAVMNDGKVGRSNPNQAIINACRPSPI